MAKPIATTFPRMIYHFSMALLRRSDLKTSQLMEKKTGITHAIMTIKYVITPVACRDSVERNAMLFHGVSNDLLGSRR